jgi:hypothetical protein
MFQFPLFRVAIRVPILLWTLPLIFQLTPLKSADVKFIPNKANVREIVLENEDVSYTLVMDRRVKLVKAIDKKTGVDVLENSEALVLVAVGHSWSLLDVGFHLFTVSERKSGQSVSVTIREQSSYTENPLVVTQTFTLGTGPGIDWQAKIEYSDERKPVPIYSGGNCRITFPIMQKLRIGSETEDNYLLQNYGYYGADSEEDVVFYFTTAYDPKMPIDIYNIADNRGIYFHVRSTKFDMGVMSKEEFREKSYSLTVPLGEEVEVIDCRIVPHEGDWHAAFYAFKKYIRDNFDFTYYKRPIQDRYKQRFISHFTFLYSHEIYDPETNTFKIHEFLDEGEINFGGYDYMLLWHDYPRLGLDNRDQFDFYDELPGGLAGLRKMVDEAHSRDVQVFIPYKPWDRMKGRNDHFKQEAGIAKAIGADGIFLDTMDKSDISFRTEVDAVSKDIVFVSEGRTDLEAAELVTGSWNQSGPATNKMPNIDLFRFVFPEHNVHNINRGARKRDELILNALFNGVGFIVWEDIFGEINKYSWNERIMIQRYNRIIHENRDAYLTDNPIPLIDALHPKLFVNEFAIDSKAVYPAYQLDRADVSRYIDDRLIGPFLEVDHPNNWHFVDVWNHQTIPVEREGGKTRLVFPEEPTDVMSCIVGFPKNLAVEVSDGKIGIQVANPVNGGTIHVNTVDNLTMMEQEALKIDGNSGQVALSDIDLKTPHKVLVKLMDDGNVLKDEVILDLGWKQF